MLERDELRACSRCKAGRFLSDFTRDKDGPLGLSRVCRSCAAEQRKVYRASEKCKAVTAAYNKKYAKLNAEKLNQQKIVRWNAVDDETRAKREAQRKEYRDKNCAILSARHAKKLLEDPAHRERNNIRALQWYENNKAIAIARSKAYYVENADQVKAYTRDREKRMRVELRPLKLARRMLRIARQIQATPAWIDLRAIDAIYCEAQKMTQLTGVRYDVDHIVPLQGRTVCGLHVAANLQPLPSHENRSKGNRYWPDQWE